MKKLAAKSLVGTKVVITEVLCTSEICQHKNHKGAMAMNATCLACKPVHDVRKGDGPTRWWDGGCFYAGF